jgi:protoporphyrinogen IX oxidase
MYEWLKALHVAAMVTWMAGMIVAPALAARGPGPHVLAALRSHLARVTTPAMVATLGLGLWMAQDAGWFRAGWLQAKLGLVFVLAGLHGVLSGQMRRLATEPDRTPPPWLGALSWVALACVLAIAVLAVIKPGTN